MKILISNSTGKPIYEQIMMQIKNAIIAGEMKEGDGLPSIRTLAKELRISVITTKRAYEELEAEGFIHTMQGKGSFVASRDLEIIKEEQLRTIEGHLQAAIDVALASDVSLDSLKDILGFLFLGA